MSQRGFKDMRNQQRKDRKKLVVKKEDVLDAKEQQEVASASSTAEKEGNKQIPKQFSILVLLADGFNVSEFGTLREVLKCANIKVTTCGSQANVSSECGWCGVTVEKSVQKAFEENESYDAVVVLGGCKGIDQICEDTCFTNLIKLFYSSSKVIATTSFGASMFLQISTDDHAKLTGHSSLKAALEHEGYRFVDEDVCIDKFIITSSDFRAAVQFSLALVESVSGVDKRTEADGMLSNLI